MDGLDESGLAKVADKYGVDEFVLGNGLNHQHPLLPQMGKHLGDIDGNVVVRAVQ